MANTFIKASKVAQLALATLYDSTIMLPLISHDYEQEFEAGYGDTVTVRKPAVFTANTYNPAVGIIKQDVTEASTTVVLDTILDTSVAATSLQKTTDIFNWQTQVLRPAMEAIAQGVDKAILAKMSAASWASTITLSAYNASTNPNPTYDLIRAGRNLTSQGVPLTDRQAVADEYITAAWRMDPLSHEADKRADEGTALRDAEIGRIHNFQTYETNGINNFKGFAFHPSAVAFVTAPLEIPEGAANAGRASYKGLTVRVVQDYDITYKTDILSIDVLFGVKVLDTNRGVLLNGLADSV